SRMLVNFQPEAMPGAVKESHAPTFAYFSRKTALTEKFLNCFVNRHPIDARLDFLQGKRLTPFHRLQSLALGFGGASPKDRSRNIAEVSALRIAWKNIEDNQRISVKRPAAAVMRVTRLVAAGNDRPAGNAARAQDGGVNFRSEHFGGQGFVVPAHSFSGSRLGRFQNFNGALESSFRNSQRMTDHFHFSL